MKKRTGKKNVDATTAGVKKELAKPRMSKSARIAELKLDVSRIPEQPSTTMSGTVDKIISSRRPRQPEKAQIAIEDTDGLRQEIRIENMLMDENGGEVSLKPGATVQVTIKVERPPAIAKP